MLHCEYRVTFHDLVTDAGPKHDSFAEIHTMAISFEESIYYIVTVALADDPLLVDPVNNWIPEWLSGLRIVGKP